MKKFILIILTITMMIGVTGCFKRDNLENISIITTVYPLEYITNKIYGKHSVVNSVYPDDTNTKNYEFKNKQLKDFSKKDLFIYLGSTDDKDIAANLVNKSNGKILIIDGSFGMEYTGGAEELWLDPSNLLMIAQNVKTGLKEYIKNTYLKKEIDDSYDELKLNLSELDASLKLTAQNASKKTIVTSNNSLKFLEKYGFNVIPLADNPTDKTISDITNKIASKEVKYIYMLDHDKENSTVKKLINNTKVKTLRLKTLDTITDEDRDNKFDYIKLMNDNIDLIKKGTYN